MGIGDWGLGPIPILFAITYLKISLIKNYYLKIFLFELNALKENI